MQSVLENRTILVSPYADYQRCVATATPGTVLRTHCEIARAAPTVELRCEFSWISTEITVIFEGRKKIIHSLTFSAVLGRSTVAHCAVWATHRAPPAAADEDEASLERVLS